MESFKIIIEAEGVSYTHYIKDMEDYEILKAVCERLQEKAYKVVRGNQPVNQETVY